MIDVVGPTSLHLLGQAATAPAALLTDPRGLTTWLLILAGMALLPFVLTMTTSFAKLVIVGGIVRQALGTQNIPPNTVLTGLALVLTIHIMSPVAREAYITYQQAQTARIGGADASGLGAQAGYFAEAIQPAMSNFLRRHASPANVQLFQQLKERLSARNAPAAVASPEPRFANPAVNALVDDLTILAPAFILTELTEAFQIGFLIFLPFLVIDLVVSNVLLAMGMHMLSPVTVSLPLKLLLFVAIDGWKLILQGLALGYA